MDERQRQQYLNAMGIDVWLPRAGVFAESVVEEPAANEAITTTVSTPSTAPSFESRFEPSFESVVAPSATVDSTTEQSPDNGNRWVRLESEVKNCRACTLAERRTNTVFGVGNRQADWLVIGEAPGEEEDLKGEPFVGRAGKLLDQMLLAMGLDRKIVYIANTVKCRPPENREPRPDEMASCAQFLRQQIQLIQPKIILLVGRVAAQSLLNTTDNVGKLRNTVHRYAATDIPMIVTYHPSYLLRSPLEKRKAWQDLQFAYRVYKQQ